MHTISLPEALELFKLPRKLGQTETGEDITIGVGRFGPFVKHGSTYASLQPEDDPYTIELPRALEVIRLKQEADAARLIADFGVDNIQVLNGRFGPYVTNGKKNAKIPKDRDPKSITLEEARVMIEQAPERGFGRFGRGRKPNNAAAAKANGGAAKGDGAAAAAAKPSSSAKKKKKGAATEKAAAGERASADRPAASAKSAPAKSTAAKSTKSARPATPPRPKGVANIVRKGRSAVAKAHARKTSARAESAGKSTQKRARGGR
jgi:DNA topoisomerase-1